MDFAIAPGLSAYDRALRRLYTNRAGTTLVNTPGIDTFRSFIAYLNRTAAAHPTQFILIGSHGDDNAFMKIQFDGAAGANTRYEDLEAADAAHTCEPTNDVILPRPVDASNNPIPPFLLIKGCRIGQSQPFMTKMKDALNGASTDIISVGAPKFFHGMTPVPKGVFEYYLYDFSVFSKTAIANKAALVAAAVAKGYRDIHNNLITQAQYESWIPGNINRGSNAIQRTRLNPSPVTGIATITTGRYRHQHVRIFPFNLNTTSTPLPAAKADRIALVKTQAAALAANPGTNALARTLAATHPFPFFKRYLYNSLNDMIDDLDWTFDVQNADLTIATGKRHEYDINPPMMENGNNNLIFNYYADAGSGTTSVMNFDDRDTRFIVLT